MTTTNSALVERRDRLIGLAPQVEALVPEKLKSEAGRICRMASLAVSMSPMLQRCTTGSLIITCATAASMGLDIGGVSGLAFAVPYRKGNVWEAQLQIGYKGWVELGHRAHRGIFARPILEGDVFEYWETHDGPHLKYRRSNADAPDWDNIQGAWVRVTGGPVPIINHLTLADVCKRRNNAQAWRAFEAGKIKSTPWKDNPGPMAAKSAVHSIGAFLPKNPYILAALELEHRAELGEPSGYSEVIDTVAEEIPQDEAAWGAAAAPTDGETDDDPRTEDTKREEYLGALADVLEHASNARAVNAAIKDAKGEPFMDDATLAEVVKRCEAHKARLKSA